MRTKSSFSLRNVLQSPPADASRTIREKYNSWIHSNNKVRCYMHASMNGVLRKKHEDMETPYEIWESLQALFGQQSDQCRHEATHSYMNAKMKKGVSIWEHVLNMINLMHETEIHGATIDERTQVSIILESLTLAFLQFTANYVMNMTQLLNELHTFEAISDTRPKEGEANVENVAEHKPSSFSGSKNKRRKNTQGGFGAQPKKGTKGKGKKNNRKEKKPKGKCFHCGVEGHWKRNFNKYLFELKDKKNGKCDLLVSEACLVEDDLSTCIVDL